MIGRQPIPFAADLQKVVRRDRRPRPPVVRAGPEPAATCGRRSSAGGAADRPGTELRRLRRSPQGRLRRRSRRPDARRAAPRGPAPRTASHRPARLPAPPRRGYDTAISVAAGSVDLTVRSSLSSLVATPMTLSVSDPRCGGRASDDPHQVGSTHRLEQFGGRVEERGIPSSRSMRQVVPDDPERLGPVVNLSVRMGSSHCIDEGEPGKFCAQVLR